MPDEADAVDVVGSPAPAQLDRRQAGRAFLRRGAGDLVELQVALVGGRPRGHGPVTVRPATFGPWPEAPPAGEEAGASDLARLVHACRAAAAEAGSAPARPLWLAPLPAALPATDLPSAEGADVVIGLVDDPAHQRRLPLAWRPAQGPLAAVGAGPGPALALQAAARVLAARLHPGRLHVYGLDLAGQGLAALSDLPHLGALLRPGEHERLHRLIGRLTDELATRQAAAGERGATASPAPPLILLLVDGVAALRGALDGPGGAAAYEGLERVVVDGAGLGLVVAVAADRLAALPRAWSAAASRRLAFRAGDPLELLALGAGRVDQSRWPDGRCLDLTSTLVAQVATGGWDEPAGRPAGDTRPGPPPLETLRPRVTLAEVLAACPPSSAPDGLRLPVGIDGRDLGVAVAHLRPGQPFLVCGPPGSGRTTATAAIGASAQAAGCEVVTAGPGLADLLAFRLAVGPGARPLVILVDDADRADDVDGALAALVAGLHPTSHLIAAAPLAAVRSAFGHWSAGLRHGGTGLVLRPRSDLDADVLGIPVLPRWSVPLTGPGRAVLVSGGEAAPVQVALP